MALTWIGNIQEQVQDSNLDTSNRHTDLIQQAPDIPGIPTDDPVNGLNYYRLLSSLKSSIGSTKTVSFAAPASYWYLKSFPIKNMARDLDYIVYMTYDLHGQWDYGNKWTSPGCETGNWYVPFLSVVIRTKLTSHVHRQSKIPCQRDRD
jgi:hypothetical protein